MTTKIRDRITKQDTFNVEVAFIDKEIKELKKKVNEYQDLISVKQMMRKELAVKYHAKKNKIEVKLDVRKFPSIFKLSEE